MCAVNSFRRTFNRVRKELSKTSGLGFAFMADAAEFKDLALAKFREAMTEEHVPATPERVNMVNSWIERATRLGY